MSEKKVSRRGYAKYAAAGVVVIGVAAAGAYYATRPGPAPTPTPTEKPTVTATESPTVAPSPTPTEKVTLNWVGAGFIIYPEAAEEYNRYTNGRVTVEYQGLPLATACERCLATGGEGWDVTANASTYMGYLFDADPPVLQPVDVEKIQNWTTTPPEGLAQYIQNPDVLNNKGRPQGEWMTESVMTRVKQMLFPDGIPPEWDGERWTGSKVWGVATGGNFEGIGYHPEFIPYEEEGDHKFTFGYEEKFKPDWKGHVGMQDDVTIGHGWVCMMLSYLDQAEFEDFGGTNENLTQNDSDTVIDFLTPYVQEGHIRTFLADFGAMLTGMTSLELWIMQCWQPVVMSTRAAGIPSYWARSPYGGEFWWSPDVVSIKTGILDEAIEWLNWRMGPWWVNFIIQNGYYCWRWNAADVQKEMGYERWAWMYNGEATYKSLDEVTKECWPDKEEFWNAPDRVKNALFHPDLYPSWSPEEGTPHSNGALKDHGSYTSCMNTQVGYVAIIPKNIDYMLERWNWLKAQLER